MQRFRKYFSFFILLSSFFIKSERNILAEVGKTVCLGLVATSSQIYCYNLLFRLKFIDKYNRVEPPFKLKDTLIALTSTVLPITIAGTLGSWPTSEIKDIFIPTALGVLTNLTAFWLKLEKLSKVPLPRYSQYEYETEDKDTMQKNCKEVIEKRYKETLNFVFKTNILFVASLCLYSLYNRYIKTLS